MIILSCVIFLPDERYVPKGLVNMDICIILPLPVSKLFKHFTLTENAGGYNGAKWNLVVYCHINWGFF
jgi:hypothetical protein